MASETFKNNSTVEASGVQKTAYRVKRRILGPKSYRPGSIYFQPQDQNGFGLPADITCPGATDICRQVCYAKEAERRPETDAKMQRNLTRLEGETTEDMAEKIRTMIQRYTAQANKLEIPEDSRSFRIHWDGDFLSTDYAKAWRTVMQENPDISFWAYTRSFQPNVNVVPILANLENLNLFMSVDGDNAERAAEVAAQYPNVRVAYLVDYYEDVTELMELLDRTKTQGYRAFACPENVINENGKRRIPLVSEKGGACQQCKYCISKRDNRDLVTLIQNKIYQYQKELPLDFGPTDGQTRTKKIETEARMMGEAAIEFSHPTLFEI